MISFVKFNQNFINLRKKDDGGRFLDIYRPGHKSWPHILVFEFASKNSQNPAIANNAFSMLHPILSSEHWFYNYITPYLVFMGPDLINISKPTPQLFIFIIKQLLEADIDYRRQIGYNDSLKIIDGPILNEFKKQEILKSPNICEIEAISPHFKKEQMDIIVDKWVEAANKRTEAVAKLKESNNVSKASISRTISIQQHNRA